MRHVTYGKSENWYLNRKINHSGILRITANASDMCVCVYCCVASLIGPQLRTDITVPSAYEPTVGDSVNWGGVCFDVFFVWTFVWARVCVCVGSWVWLCMCAGACMIVCVCVYVCVCVWEAGCQEDPASRGPPQERSYCESSLGFLSNVITTP